MSSDTNEYEARVTKMTVSVVGEAIFHEQSIDIEIEDEAAGEYLVLKPHEEHVVINGAKHWAAVRDAIDKMVATLRDD